MEEALAGISVSFCDGCRVPQARDLHAETAHRLQCTLLTHPRAAAWWRRQGDSVNLQPTSSFKKGVISSQAREYIDLNS